MTAASNVYTSPRVAPLLVLGFASGLPLALTSGTLQAWATVEGVPLQQIGFLTLVGTAYTLKFLWAPFVDRYVPPLLGRRRGWMLLTQLLLAVAIMAMGALSPSSSLQPLALLAVAVAFLSATQDIAFDAYCTDVLRKEERGAGAAIKVMGYRLAMIVSGGLALILADQWIGWGNTYVLMGGLMLLCALATLWAPEPEHVASAPRNLRAAVGEPLREFFTRRGALAVLLLIVLYKLGDAFAGALSTTFLIRGAGFSPTEVGTVNKVLGLAATIVGALAGGSVMSRWGLYRSLMAFGLLQAVSNLAYWLIAISPKNLWLMATGVGIENLCGGLGTASFVGLLMALCRQRFSATQFALLSALSAVGRTYLAGPLTPPLVDSMGWPGFFLLTVVIALPGLVLLKLLRGTIETMEKQGDS
ncbi:MULTISPECIES: muropeptide transporter [Achromobacter]|uniref:Muropeptide transporter n=1 Tax=Achromobacter denitrificans TaxID=32002 RepID=A0A6N0JW09_ACHDE|nr:MULTISPECIES: muropeptide transporter [Achromobacter]ASC64257.1 MFS transporter [Achromobacter denitrificans]MDF3941642.1 muropeptide transporter [Achromobacter denitrificans]OLU06860.1 MFS transporter [Achromobacter denitrificans]QKH46039.1 muropeptide transporter [Achromobacter denitrificans]QKH53719.1 muropeptide transporter [Achromobacter denitrificans]